MKCSLDASSSVVAAEQKELFPNGGGRSFPMDSVHYTGRCMIKGQKGPLQEKIAIKFMKNNANGFNVAGKGVNEIGEFVLSGTFLPMSSKSGKVSLGLVERREKTQTNANSNQILSNQITQPRSCSSGSTRTWLPCQSGKKQAPNPATQTPSPKPPPA